jgi:hypothetical protein
MLRVRQITTPTEDRWFEDFLPGAVYECAISSRSKPDRGMIRTIEVLNQNGNVIMSLKAMNLLRLRPPAEERPG